MSFSSLALPDASPTVLGTPPPGLPRPRGPLSAALSEALGGPVHDLGGSFASLAADAVSDGRDVLIDEDLQLALYCCYELHYAGFGGVDPDWEWEPSLLAGRRVLESALEEALCGGLGVPGPVGASALGATHDPAGSTAAQLWSMATAGGGPSLSAWVGDHGTADHARELAVLRSAYQLKEADPHTWAIPRLRGPAKAAMVEIQYDEYGSGRPAAMHAALFADTMAALGLDPVYGAYLDRIPGWALATTNLISWLGLHRRLRGALVGHLALFEMTSIGPMGRYSAWLERLGVPVDGRAFYDVHVVADQRHQHVAADDLVGGLLRAEPEQAGAVSFGARALSLVEGTFTARVLDAWGAGRSALRD